MDEDEDRLWRAPKAKSTDWRSQAQRPGSACRRCMGPPGRQLFDPLLGLPSVALAAALATAIGAGVLLALNCLALRRYPVALAAFLAGPAV